MYEVVPLTSAHLDRLNLPASMDRRAYFSLGSIALCLLKDGIPVFAGGLVNLMWNRAEAWILPTPFFRSHTKTCFRELRDYLPVLMKQGHFRRVQATCVYGIHQSRTLFKHLGFEFEGMMRSFGPSGEDCEMHSLIFEERT